MVKVNIFTSIKSAGAELAYPLLKWRKAVRAAGIEVNIAHATKDASNDADLNILTHPFYRDRYKTNNEYFSKAEELIKADIKLLRKNSGAIVFFDTTDSTASPYFNLLPYVDVMFKRQTLVDRSYYFSREYETAGNVWLAKNSKIRPRADTRYLDKLKVAWGFQYGNYSLFRKGGRHFHWRGLTWDPLFKSVDRPRPLLTTFRGEFSGSRGEHRMRAVDAMRRVQSKKIALGKKLSRKKYLSELGQCKAVVSPFGYGEICFRDFEAFISGGVLVKPSMAHLYCFPNLYHTSKNYIAVKWDFSNLAEVLEDINENYSDYRSVAKQGQEEYKRITKDPDYCIAHLRRLLRSVGIARV